MPSRVASAEPADRAPPGGPSYHRGMPAPSLPFRAARFLALALLAAGAVSAAPLSAPEASFDASIRRGSVPALADTAGPRVRAAHAALAAELGRRERAGRLAATVQGFDDDCAHRARRAELGLGTACEGLEPSTLGEPVLLEDPIAFALLAAKPGEEGRLLVSKVLVEALDALSAEGGLQVESTADRFRITGRSALEGVWYLEDRILVAARPGEGLPEDEALAALARLLALHGGESLPAALEGTLEAEPEPVAPPPMRTDVLGWNLELPADFVPTSAVPNAWVPLADRDRPFPPEAGAVLVSPGTPAEPERGRKKRNPIARRRGSVEASPPPDEKVLPPGAELVSAREMFGGVRELEWRTATGRARTTMLRVLDERGREAVLVVHLGTRLDGDRAVALLAGARPSR